MMSVLIKRIYDLKENDKGYRVLVDRIWPRGVSKEDANLDEWLKDIAPSTELRKWFDHRKERFEEFSIKYQKEIQKHPEIIRNLIEKAKSGKLILLYGDKDEKHNQAVVLKNIIEEEQ